MHKISYVSHLFKPPDSDITSGKDFKVLCIAAFSLMPADKTVLFCIFS